MTRDEHTEFDALIAKLGIDGEAAQTLREFAEKVADAAYDRGQGIQQDIQSGRL